MGRRSSSPQALSDRGYRRFVKVEGNARLKTDKKKIKEAARGGTAEGDRRQRARHGPFGAARPLPRTLPGRGELPDHQARPQGAAGLPLEAGAGEGAHRHRLHGVRLRRASGLPGRAAAEGVDVAGKGPAGLGHRQCPIIRDKRSGRCYALPSTTTPDMERICRTLGLPKSRAPYRIE